MAVVRTKLEELTDTQPLLGLRGCRYVSVTCLVGLFSYASVRISALMPWLTEMQVKAVIGAAVEVAAEGQPVFPEIGIPMICSEHELASIVPRIHEAARSVIYLLL